jgi:uncharacterized membrane protein AbrB (regulator of aidB expression)
MLTVRPWAWLFRFVGMPVPFVRLSSMFTAVFCSMMWFKRFWNAFDEFRLICSMLGIKIGWKKKEKNEKK